MCLYRWDRHIEGGGYAMNMITEGFGSLHNYQTAML